MSRYKVSLTDLFEFVNEIGIDSDGKLYIKPTARNFEHIWQTATEVHWDSEKKWLYSPMPREWTYLQWFQHIVGVVSQEYNILLFLIDTTIWVNIDDQLKMEFVVAQQSKLR